MNRAALDQALITWHEVFPIRAPIATLAAWDGPVWDPRLGLLAHMHLHDSETFRGPSGYVVVASPEEVERWPTLVNALALRWRALLEDDAVARAALARPIGDALGLSSPVAGPETFKPTAEDEQRRQRALQEAWARFGDVAAHVQRVYGLRLPRHIAVWHAFWASLSPLEEAGMGYMGRGPAGIMLFFDEGGLARKTRDGLDPRLECRFRCDPPEFVSVMSGDTDGLHYGLWYDDPAELPSFIASNYARDSAETGRDESTVLKELAKEVRERVEEPDYPDEPPPISLWAARSALLWFAEADDAALAQDGPR
jgi:hypothetical protein